MKQALHTNGGTGMSSDVAALFGTKQGVTETVKPMFELAGPGKPPLNPHEHIATQDDNGLEKAANMMVREGTLSVSFFLTIAKPFNVSQVDGLDGVLKTMRGNDTGEFGRLVLDTNAEVKRMKKRMPKLDQRFIEKFRKGLAMPKEVINFVFSIVNELETAFKGFDDMLAAVNENESLMEDFYKSANELVQTCVDLSIEQDERTLKLLKLLALVDYLRIAVAERLEAIEKEIAEMGEDKSNLKALEDERARLSAVSPLILRRTQNVTPMVLKGNINEKRFTDQAQLNAFNALDLRDYIDIYIAQIKTDIVTGLLAIKAQANMFAIRTGVDLAQKASDEANAQYKEQVAQAADMIQTMLTDLEKMHQLLEDTITAGNTLNTAFANAAQAGQKASGEVEDGMNLLKDSEKAHRKEILRIMKDHDIEEVPEEATV